MSKQPFEIDKALKRIAAAVADLPKAALFQLYDEGYRSPLEQLIACMISIRTLDETTAVCARTLFAQARTAADLARLEVAQIEQAIRQSTFHEPKAAQIQTIARDVAERYSGELPCEFAVLTAFHGVGPKCANLVLGIACGQPAIGVDVHVHRITNRWGYITARSPEQTLTALEAKLPQQHWVEINRLLVPFGKHICTGSQPRCSTCPVLAMCRQVGVTAHR